MAYILDGSTIRRPHEIDEDNSTLSTEQRTLDGAYKRDYFGSNKRVWTLSYENVNVSDYNTIRAIYQSYLSTGATKTFQSTESNYTIAATSVHVDLVQRRFRVRGSSYLSDFTLTLTEA